MKVFWKYHNKPFACDCIMWRPSTTACVVANSISLWRPRRVKSRRISRSSLFRPRQTTINLNSTTSETGRARKQCQDHRWGPFCNVFDETARCTGFIKSFGRWSNVSFDYALSVSRSSRAACVVTNTVLFWNMNLVQWRRKCNADGLLVPFHGARAKPRSANTYQAQKQDISVSSSRIKMKNYWKAIKDVAKYENW